MRFLRSCIAWYRSSAGSGAGTSAGARSAELRSLPTRLLADTGKAAIEADFVGTHTGEFAGIAPTGRDVRVPYSVIYDLRDDQISALRIYFPMNLLIEQLTR